MDSNSVVIPKQASIGISISPVQSFISSLMILNKTDHFPGLSSDLVRIFHSLTDEERLNNRIVVHGLVYCFVNTGYFWYTVPDYLSSLEEIDPEKFKELLFRRYADVIHIKNSNGKPGEIPPPAVDQENALASEDDFLEFIRDNFEIRYADFEVEALSYRYLVDPPKLKSFIISHLKLMWEKYFAPEWKRNKTMLVESVSAFQSLDLGKLERNEALKTVTGHKAEEVWDLPWVVEWFSQVDYVMFVPSAHLGPYIVKITVDNMFYVFFGARLPEGKQSVTSDLNRSEISVRLNALADGTRLRILKLIIENGELSSQQIMNRLELSQSAASRHLKQLSATGFLKERRQTSAKIYEINPEFVEKTVKALSGFLQKEGKSSS